MPYYYTGGGGGGDFVYNLSWGGGHGFSPSHFGLGSKIDNLYKPSLKLLKKKRLAF